MLGQKTEIYWGDPEDDPEVRVARDAGWPDILIKAIIDDPWSYGVLLRSGAFIVCEGVTPAAGGAWVHLRGVDRERCSHTPAELLDGYWNERGIEIPFTEIMAVVQAGT